MVAYPESQSSRIPGTSYRRIENVKTQQNTTTREHPALSAEVTALCHQIGIAEMAERTASPPVKGGVFGSKDPFGPYHKTVLLSKPTGYVAQPVPRNLDKKEAYRMCIGSTGANVGVDVEDLVAIKAMTRINLPTQLEIKPLDLRATGYRSHGHPFCAAQRNISQYYARCTALQLASVFNVPITEVGGKRNKPLITGGAVVSHAINPVIPDFPGDITRGLMAQVGEEGLPYSWCDCKFEDCSCFLGAIEGKPAVFLLLDTHYYVVPALQHLAKARGDAPTIIVTQGSYYSRSLGTTSGREYLDFPRATLQGISGRSEGGISLIPAAGNRVKVRLKLLGNTETYSHFDTPTAINLGYRSYTREILSVGTTSVSVSCSTGDPFVMKVERSPASSLQGGNKGMPSAFCGER